jgi:3-oxoacyl-[acyl-carrier protein] reductase
MLLDLTDRVVIVTGAARGIGRAIAERFAQEGSHVVALDLVPPPEGESPAGMVPLACDVSDSASVRSAVAQVVERFGRVDVLVNNAGINAEGLLEDLDDGLWQRCFDINVGGVFRMCREVAPIMKRQSRGRIINAASFAAIVPSVASSAYAASKAAVVQMTRVYASELGPWDITVNSYAPGMIPTTLNGFAEMEQAAQDRLLDTLSLRRWGDAGDVASLVTFLASDAAGYITGALIDVSGGKLATQIPQKAYESARTTP